MSIYLVVETVTQTGSETFALAGSFDVGSPEEAVLAVGRPGRFRAIDVGDLPEIPVKLTIDASE